MDFENQQTQDTLLSADMGYTCWLCVKLKLLTFKNKRCQTFFSGFFCRVVLQRVEAALNKVDHPEVTWYRAITFC